VPACDVAARGTCDLEAAAQDVAGEVERERVPGPAEQVDGDHGRTAHGVDVGQGVGRRYSGPVVRVVHDRGEEVRRCHDGPAVGYPYHRGVVTRF